MKDELVFHTIPPVYNEESRVLLLGTMPSPKSRQAGFYYGHPQNRMWPVLAPGIWGRNAGGHRGPGGISCCGIILPCGMCWHPVPSTGQRTAPFGRHCPMISAPCWRQPPLRPSIPQGKRHFPCTRKYLLPMTGREAVCLPSTSPANCRWETMETLTAAYHVLKAAGNPWP